ncbi:MAG: hypothetical protein JWR85_4075 [Marmoricola sp.]|nr:hypothetical protein [Marmoricola sp.]
MSGVNYGELLQNATFTTRKGILPEGTYTAEIKEAEVKTTANGNPKIATTFVVVEGEEAGRKVFNDIVTPREGTDEKARKAAGIFFDKLFALGLSPEFVRTVQTNEQLANAILGKRADIVVYHDEWNNKTRAKVRYINPPSVPAQAAGPIPAAGFTPPAAATSPGAFTPAAAPAPPTVNPTPPAPPTGFQAPPIGTLMAPPAPPAAPVAAAPAAPEAAVPAAPPVAPPVAPPAPPVAPPVAPVASPTDPQQQAAEPLPQGGPAYLATPENQPSPVDF